eukprot:CAMPEP_0172596334 /NCGR_PEP_ID=MMETSP1068-20121228/16092_1 /TAXON_ID=35684 /ORGANISM="Pseudopedinella elastica, Strain CCMP716" /LENGTH=553 /DNA_ID=CAMNT_0013395299 /DNA_START=145 /DNA_END=1806 /DNA_ORIENTATION=+
MSRSSVARSAPVHGVAAMGVRPEVPVANCDRTTADSIWYLEQVLTSKVYDVCIETPLQEMSRLSERVGSSILVKREDMQPVFSFKLRGAYNMIANLPQERLDKGIITASAGNHAQGVAMSAKHLGCKAIIAMPTVTPAIKVNSVRRLGAEVVLVGENFDETKGYAVARSEADGMQFIPPFDHPLVIAGQGTIGMEILRACTQPIDAIFVPVGGGGLIAGIAAYVKRLKPEVLIIGVEPEGANAMFESLRTGAHAVLDKVDTFADGVAVKTTGTETLRIARDLVDDVILVDTDEICVAIKDIFEDTRSITEPSGALAVAGAKKWLEASGHSNKRVVAITSGANMNFDKLRTVAERSGSNEGEEALLHSMMKERKGEFLRFVETLGGAGVKRAGDRTKITRFITEFKYRYNQDYTSRTGEAQVFYSVATASSEDSEVLVSELNKAGLKTVNLSKNELAKSHIRFMGGGGSPIDKERFFKVDFPETPGALTRFLTLLGDKFNISLFHYRYTGQNVGDVFLGILPMEESEVGDFQAIISELDWSCTDMTDDPACQFV